MPLLRRGDITVTTNDSSSPDPLWHVHLLSWLSINVVHEREGGIKALHSEESVDKRVEQPLVKVIVDPSTVDALREKGPQSTPWHFVRG